MKSEVIITDGHWRKSLAAVRALGKKGIKTAVGESTRVATSMFSKYCRRAFVYPSPVHRPLDIFPLFLLTNWHLQEARIVSFSSLKPKGFLYPKPGI